MAFKITRAKGAVAAVIGVFLGSFVFAQAATSVFATFQGGTGTSTPSGILYGDAGGTNHLNTVTVGSGLTFTGGTLSAAGGSGTVTQINTTWPILGGPITTTGTLTFGGLSTSTAAVIGNIPYFSGVNTFANVGTSTLSASSPLTGSFTQLGSGGSLGCQTASGSQAGCLSSSDWSTFNAKQAGGFQIGTTSNIAISQLAYYTNTGTTLGGAATSTLSFSGPFTTSGTLGALVGGSNFTLTLPVANASIDGYLSHTDWNTFNGKGSGTVTSLVAGTGLNGGTITSSGTLSLISYLATSSSETAGQLAAWGSTASTPAKLYSIATSSISVSSGLTNTGTLGAQVGGSALSLKQIENRSFTYATTTAWTGTTTISLGVGYGEVWNTIKCFTDVGTLNTQFGYGSASTTMFNASTTIGTIVATPNNTMTSGNKVAVDLGTPASSPTKVSCTVNDTN